MVSLYRYREIIRTDGLALCVRMFTCMQVLMLAWFCRGQRTILDGDLQMLSAWIVGLRSLLTRNCQVSPWDPPISAAPMLGLQTQDDAVLGQCLSVLLISWYKTLSIDEITEICLLLAFPVLELKVCPTMLTHNRFRFLSTLLIEPSPNPCFWKCLIVAQAGCMVRKKDTYIWGIY